MTYRDLIEKARKLEEEAAAVKAEADKAKGNEQRQYADSVLEDLRELGWDPAEIVSLIAPHVAKAVLAKRANGSGNGSGNGRARKGWKSPHSGQVYWGGAQPKWLVLEALGHAVSEEPKRITAWVRENFERVAA